ncbi:MAG: SDR family oxidoreductase [Planctomycetota bacterium]|nr:SDR family oxidoreductase [Planctomycetota bacterium]
MDLQLKGRHALVCGASAGIGQATARALASLNAELTLLARSKDKLESQLGALKAAGASKIHVLIADLDKRDQLKETIAAHIAAVGSIQILINNTGGPAPGPLLKADESDLLNAFGRHVLASQIFVKALLPGMVEAGYGRIINVISTSVREPIPNLGVSNTIRGAMASWSKTLSRELPPGVTINNVLPGFTATGRLAQLAESIAKRNGSSVADVETNWKAQVPEGRLAQPEELGQVIAFLASPAASYVRGQSLAVDGGRLRGI